MCQGKKTLSKFTYHLNIIGKCAGNFFVCPASIHSTIFITFVMLNASITSGHIKSGIVQWYRVTSLQSWEPGLKSRMGRANIAGWAPHIISPIPIATTGLRLRRSIRVFWIEQTRMNHQCTHILCVSQQTTWLPGCYRYQGTPWQQSCMQVFWYWCWVSPQPLLHRPTTMHIRKKTWSKRSWYLPCNG